MGIINISSYFIKVVFSRGVELYLANSFYRNNIHSQFTLKTKIYGNSKN